MTLFFSLDVFKHLANLEKLPAIFLDSSLSLLPSFSSFLLHI